MCFHTRTWAHKNPHKQLSCWTNVSYIICIYNKKFEKLKQTDLIVEKNEEISIFLKKEGINGMKEKLTWIIDYKFS